MIFKIIWFLSHKGIKPRAWFAWYLKVKDRTIIRPFDRQLLGRQNLTGAEVGVLAGEHAKTLLKNQSIRWLYLVDQYKEYVDFSQEQMDQACRNMQVKLCQFTNKSLLKVPSAKAAVTMVPLDFVYIDAAHDYDSVAEDIKLWWSKVKPGGLLGGHDFDFGHPGVIKAVIEFAVHNNLKLETLNPDWWIWKP